MIKETKRLSTCLSFLLLLLPPSLKATSQIPDVLIIDGIKHDILTNPLEPFLEL